ncbi:MAG: hypothetical protein QOI24_2619 [Acidobacteriota bacterium]|jgi:hypothetical protein|nr:hypothetical protein [Acidobacteriota bacterium]
MAIRKKASSGGDIDWYLISIDRLKQIGLVLFILLLGGAGYWFLHNEKGNPRANAESAIADARQALNTLAASKDFPNRRGEFERAQKKLEDANTLFGAAKYVDAQGAAVESQTISRAAVSGGDSGNGDAQFITVEGDVQFQKSTNSDWHHAEMRVPLYNGDWVKTGDRASAELLFTSNGSLYTVGPNALLEIYAAVQPGSSKKNNAVQMQVGTVEVATVDQESSVRTPGTQIIVDSESTTQVGVDSTKSTSVVSTKGSASVTPKSGGEAVVVSSGEKISASPEGGISPVKKLILPPALKSPSDNQVFQVTNESKVEFAWEPQTGATSYQLQVSRSRLFSTLEINSKRQKLSASAKVTDEGAFYWRVASIGADGEVGPYSPFRRFRVSGGGRDTSSGGGVNASDATPPKLTLKRPQPIGGAYYIIEGTTEPGSTVFINEEEVDVESSGHFKKLIVFAKVGQNAVVVKAVDPAGNQTVQSQTVLVEE